MDVYRSELRPSAEIEDKDFSSVGACWSWHPSGAGVCNHDNAYDQHGRDAEEVMFEASVALHDIDWVQTMAKNLVLRNEKEINIRDSSTVELISMNVDKAYSPLSRNVVVCNHDDF